MLFPSVARNVAHVILRLSLVFLVVALVLVAASLFWNEEPAPDSAEAARVARDWVGAGQVQELRLDGDEWEVDVVRADGSLIEVTIGKRLELLGLDEELGPDGSPPDDEVTGSRRLRAAQAALAAVSGAVLGVEREPDGLEVAVRRADGERVEVGLDQRLRVAELEAEERGDE